MMAEYKQVSNHPRDLADGRMLAPGQTAELDADQVQDPHNAAMIEEGHLIVLSGKTKSEATESAEDAAARLAVDLADVKGTGKDKRITAADVEAFAKKREERGER